ncbi:hypothetical protein [Roseibium sediminicola]|uniref:Uncharacterized protein n=1 Tax=Roseibium sediminicola TaxID=2933272 RepID=A0ABT0GZW2_9HYPH|nr:hypothetical protein [Roseibium sp. CAU 1639]MCK7614969.1 hypothetical protein [Roseibium sp. CAU 1639]
MLIAYYVLCALLFVGALLHGYGSLIAYSKGSTARVWSLGSAAQAALLAALVAVIGPEASPEPVSVIALIGVVAWLITIIAFGRAISKLTDPRVIYHFVVSVLLAGILAAGLAGMPLA